MDDLALLREYLEHHSEKAFSELVERHLPLVYGTALRVVADAHAAQDVAQAVFIQLARKAWTIREGRALPGWLYRATRHGALAALRSESRRRQRETDAMNLAEQNQPAAADWAQIAPLLDEAMAGLSHADQDAVVLRFFQDQSYCDVGRALGLGEEAARKRVERSLEKIRAYFALRGVTATAALLGTTIAAHAEVAPPVALARTVTGASLSSATAASGLAHFQWQAFFMSTKSKIITAAVIMALLASIPMFFDWRKSNDTTPSRANNAGTPLTHISSPALPPKRVENAPIAPPLLPPVVALAPTATAPAGTADVPAPVNTSLTPAAGQSRLSAVTNNLRILGASAQQFMLDNHTSRATYYDLVGSGTDAYVRSITPVTGEDYTGLIIEAGDTQISISSSTFGTVTYDL